MEESGGKFLPLLINLMNENQKGRKKRKKKKEEKGTGGDRGRKGKKGKGKFSFFFNGRSSMVREIKSVHAIRATIRYQNQGVSSNSKR